jgi:8-amino-7-oxononanoate synthase
VFSTAPPPALAAALDASLDIVASEPERRTRLLAAARLLRSRLADGGLVAAVGDSQIVPVVCGGVEAAMRLAATLQAQGFDVRAIRPPSVPQGTARLRISVNAGLSDATIDRFSTALIAAAREVGLCSAECS